MLKVNMKFKTFGCFRGIFGGLFGAVSSQILLGQFSLPNSNFSVPYKQHPQKIDITQNNETRYLVIWGRSPRGWGSGWVCPPMQAGFSISSIFLCFWREATLKLTPKSESPRPTPWGGCVGLDPPGSHKKKNWINPESALGIRDKWKSEKCFRVTWNTSAEGAFSIIYQRKRFSALCFVRIWLTVSEVTFCLC